MTSHNMHNEFVFVSQSIAKKRTFGQKDCTIWEMRERERERSGVFIHHNLEKKKTGRDQNSVQVILPSFALLSLGKFFETINYFATFLEMAIKCRAFFLGLEWHHSSFIQWSKDCW